MGNKSSRSNDRGGNIGTLRNQHTGTGTGTGTSKRRSLSTNDFSKSIYPISPPESHHDYTTATGTQQQRISYHSNHHVNPTATTTTTASILSPRSLLVKAK